MAELIQVTYANSLFDVVAAKRIESEVREELIALKDIFEAQPDFVKLLSSPVISNQEKHQMIHETFFNKVSLYVLNFFKVLVDNNRFSLVLEIISEYCKLYDKNAGIIAVTAITAAPMSDTLQQRLTKRLSESSGKTIRLTTIVDPAVLGGIKLKYDNTEIDATIQSKLQEMKHTIQQTIL
ncbi:ATP synthase F1 subunit delta [Paludicola sp. MB14-C6]|uniref:ATP synthase F1 subunit delta n=1 Tax=Paludihabitans sp. MB14-C6 TaxID=3070656 RepID=UPI0027DE1EBD|nr:ATP synthase F1 subunit delta [Paludicola sp. MB14-C6]WMJ21824.1 ATP synthase F1 subunit delta [Paludicola sp. MB14-C6]